VHVAIASLLAGSTKSFSKHYCPNGTS